MTDEVLQVVDANAATVRPGGGTVTIETRRGPVAMELVARGDVAAGDRTYAVDRLAAVIGRIDEPVLVVRVKLTKEPDPGRDRPALAQVSIDLNGKPVRAQLSARTMTEAIDLVQSRLRDKLEHRAKHREALRKRPAESGPGEWRHGDPPTRRPDHFDRPPEDRVLVRRKTYDDGELTVDEAAFDMEQLDFDFYLFRDLVSGDDALLERGGDGSFRLTRARATSAEAGPTAVPLVVAEQPAPELTTDEAIEHLDLAAEHHVFYVDRTTGRGTVLYRRYDGHYGLLTPA